MDDYTIVEKYQQSKSSTVAIRPYFNEERENMGLETYGMSLHEGVWHQESLACLEMNGVKRYVTGLNEFAPEVKKLSPGEKEIKVKEIRKAVAQLESELAANFVDSVQYTKSTQTDIIYENMDAHINGKGTESNKKRAAEEFITASNDNMKNLKVRALVKDAMFYRFILIKANGWIETLDSGIRLGKVPSEVAVFLTNPENDEVLKSLMNKVEPYWNA